MKRIGILAVQGAVAEHRRAVERTFESLGIKGEVVLVRTESDLNRSDALIIPGGESTTISKLINKFGLAGPIKRRACSCTFPVLGTCAGAVLLASKGDAEVRRTGTELLKLMDYSVSRNAFGRQRESFEMPLLIDGIASASEPFPGVFIRAPLILECRSDCVPIARLKSGRGIIAARQGNLLALVFHPELTDDLRVHRFFIGLI